jgi:hypothetical protein
VAIRQSPAYHQILSKVRMAAADERSIGVLSMGERIAVALVLDRPDLLPETYGTILEAVDRLGADWLTAAILVHRDRASGWWDE